jgi:hypothetical protein
MGKCPYCGSNNIGIVSADEGKSWGLVEFEDGKETTSIDRVLNVKVYGCLDCNSLMLQGTELSKR